MRRTTPEEWEKKYIVEPQERFDQKNELYKRSWWDPGLKQLWENVYGEKIAPRDKAGWTLQDIALGDGAWYLERAFGHGNVIGQHGPFAWEEKPSEHGFGRVAEGLKIDVDDGEKVTRDIKKVATYYGADMVGVCKLDRRWIYSHSYNRYTKESKPLEVPEDCKYAIAMAYDMDYELIKYAPSHIGNGATGMGYSRMAFSTGLLAKFIRSIGFKAIPCGNDTAPSVPVAMQAGLGELGRHGLLITPEYGPRVRLSKIFTDLPLVPDQPMEFGVTEFCAKCQKCAEYCPGQAIIYGERISKPHNASNAAGQLKWPINAEKCLSFWGTNKSTCIVCIRVCPFNKQMNWFHRSVRSAAEQMPRATPFFVKMDDLLGFGKQAKPKKFWDDWQPRRALVTRRK